MKNLANIKNLFLAIFTALVFTSCIEEGGSPIIDDTDDPYMAKAEDFVDDYMTTQPSARGGKHRTSVTVLQYQDGELYYATNTDDIKGYHPVEEQTITAYVEPGEYMFWVTGKDVTYLDGIEFDVVAQNQMGPNHPADIANSKVWLVQIPEDIETTEDGHLKYDIIYEYKGNEGNPIRLDPKLKINN
jgi:hypothetical protein